MSATLISLNPDLAKLEAEGYRLRIVRGIANHLIVEGVPAVNTKGELVYGEMYTPLEIDAAGQVRNPVANHQCWWIGADPPCDHTGRVMEELIANTGPEDKGDGIKTRVGMSRKLKSGNQQIPYPDYYKKLTTYIALIWSPAVQIEPTCTPKLDKPVRAVVEAQASVFHYPDMATTRAGIGAATTKLLVGKVAIVGLGGTGSYILDLLAKTPVGEIHLFDGDEFELHNAFRAPGAPAKAELTNPKKVDWFAAIYDRMREGIVRHAYHVRTQELAELRDMSFVFLAVDDPKAKKVMIDFLLAEKIPFIDVGMDVSLDRDVALRGQVRVTVATPAVHVHVDQVISFADGPENNIYRNIQVADLNMLNAALAVIRWKKWLGFYADDANEYHSLYSIQTGSLIKGVVP
jgi:ThiF family